MYTLSQLRRGVRRGLDEPRIFGRELNRLYYRRWYRWDYNHSGIDVVAADWDTLLILDGCRYDMFERQYDLPGNLERRQSRGSHTLEFLDGNFGGRTLDDVVYVTASPMLHRYRNRIGDVRFHAVVDVWKEDGWDEQYRTVLPETMADYLRRTTEQYPNKRLIGHFVQPHYPFLGRGSEHNTGRLEEGEDTGLDVWGRLMRGDLAVPPERIREAVRDNIDAVLPAVEELLAELPGRTVVTADHGNMIGERAWPVPIREWGHPPGVYTEQLVTVPWLVHESGDRPEITAEANRRDEEVDHDVVADRLQHLGYAE
jgi:hypothetical protein